MRCDARSKRSIMKSVYTHTSVPKVRPHHKVLQLTFLCDKGPYRTALYDTIMRSKTGPIRQQSSPRHCHSCCHIRMEEASQPAEHVRIEYDLNSNFYNFWRKKLQFLPYGRSIGSWICLTHKTYTCHTVQNTIRYDIRFTGMKVRCTIFERVTMYNKAKRKLRKLQRFISNVILL
jgi:hypothetical protein